MIGFRRTNRIALRSQLFYRSQPNASGSLERNRAVEGGRGDLRPRTGVPLTASAAAFAAPGPSPPAGPEDLSNFIRWLTYGAPRIGGAAASYDNYYQIVQTPEYVMFLSEAMHDARIIPLDGHPHLPQDIRRWLGDSCGRWPDVGTMRWRPRRDVGTLDGCGSPQADGRQNV